MPNKINANTMAARIALEARAEGATLEEFQSIYHKNLKSLEERPLDSSVEKIDLKDQFTYKSGMGMEIPPPLGLGINGDQFFRLRPPLPPPVFNNTPPTEWSVGDLDSLERSLQRYTHPEPPPSRRLGPTAEEIGRQEHEAKMTVIGLGITMGVGLLLAFAGAWRSSIHTMNPSLMIKANGGSDTEI